MKILFNRPYLGKSEISSIIRVIKSGVIGGNGPGGQRLEIFLRKLFKIKYILF